MELTGGECPRCGRSMISLNIDTVAWNRLSFSEKEKTINRVVPKIPVSEVFLELVRESEPEPDPMILRQDTVEIPVIDHIRETETDVEPVVTPLTAPSAKITPRKVPNPNLKQEADVKFDMVYACYKCNSIAGHDGTLTHYYCSECGSDMVDIGITTKEWAELSKEDKRKITEEARIRHMVTAIKEASYDESDAEHMQNIINVVGNMAL